MVRCRAHIKGSEINELSELIEIIKFLYFGIEWFNLVLVSNKKLTR
jgi:hypothetical protein